jgi:DNA-binding SARP family transcriptional activator/predicted ATPase
MPLAFQLLGTVQVTWNNQPLKFATEHTRALLAYLAVEANVAHRRTRLATLLWPEEAEASARHNLRQALFFLKQSLATVPAWANLLQITPTTVQWHSQEVTVDLRAFQARWRQSQGHDHPPTQLCATCVEALTQAVALYQGEFLQGLLLKANPLFEEWALLLREQSHQQALTMLNTLTTHYAATGAYDQMAHYAARQVALEPWHEEGHRQLMQALAAQGQQSAALRQYESCRRLLEQELGAPPSTETTRLYEQIRTGNFDKVTRWQGDKVASDRATERAPWAPASGCEVTLSPLHLVTPARRHNLPAFLPPLVGYTQQLHQLRTLIDSPDHRLITLVGLGGMGKTRLALALLEQVAAEAPTPFADGCWFVPLVGVAETTNDLPAALAGAALNVIAANPPQQETLSATLFHYLAQRQLLLVFDNLEQLLLAEEHAAITSQFLLALLEAAPGLKLVITSRLPVQLLAETVIRLDGLPVPSERLVEEASAADESASLRLFVYHAQRVLPGFILDPAKRAAASELCRRLGGMPLAIELAATLVPHFTIDELTTAIAQNLTLLTSKRRDLDGRHRQLRAVLESSWQQLSADEQAILAQSAIFVGHFSREALQAVTGATIADVSALVDKALMQQRAVAKYQLHPLLRQFAAERLQEQGSQWQWQVADQHSRYYLAFVAKRTTAMARHGLQQAIVEIQQALDNVRQAWAWTVEAIQQGLATALPVNPADFCRRLDAAARPMWQFYVTTCRYREGNDAFQQAVTAVQSLVDEVGEREEEWQQLLTKLLGLQATFLCIQGQPEQALPVALAARRRSVCWPSRDGEILALNALVHIYYSQGELAQAKTQAEAVLNIVHHPTARHDEAWPSEIAYSAQSMAHIYLGAIARTRDDYPQATYHFTQTLHLCQALGKVMGTMDARMNLADLARCKQAYAAARQEYEAVIQIAYQLGNLRGEGLARYELADTLRGLGEYALALPQFTQALALFREIGDPLLLGYASSSLAIYYTHLGDYPTAQHFCRQALDQCEALTMPDAKPAAWLAAAIFYHLTGDDPQALAYATRSRESAQSQQSRQGEASALLHMAFAYEGLQLWAAAADAYCQARQLYQRLDIAPARLEAAAGLARVALAQGQRLNAMAWAEQILTSLPQQANVGLYEPFGIYSTLYHVLTANADPRAATVLQQGYDLLQQVAAPLDEATRQRFLTAVPVNRRLVAAYLAWQTRT